MPTSQQTTSMHRYYRSSCERLGPSVDRFYRVVSQHEFMGSTRYVVECVSLAQASIEVVSPALLSGAEKISAEEWADLLTATEKAEAKRKAAAEAKADALRYGVHVKVCSYYAPNRETTIVRATRTQWISLSGGRYKRQTGSAVGKRSGRILDDDLRLLEERCGGAERFDFVADGKRRRPVRGCREA